MFFYLLALFACTSTPLTGKVLDGSGLPVEGVSVSVLSTECVTHSNIDGNYALNCAPMKGTIAFNKKGFIGAQQTFDFSNQERLELTPQTLVQIPPTAGLYIRKDGEYHALGTASLLRHSNHKGKEVQRKYCLQAEKNNPTKIKPGTISIFAYQSQGWRLFRMDADRCAYSDTRKSSGRWVVGHRDKPALSMKPLGDAFAVHTAELKPGHYFAANWDGFFVPTEKGADTYSGHWFKVEE